MKKTFLTAANKTARKDVWRKQREPTDKSSGVVGKRHQREKQRVFSHQSWLTLQVTISKSGLRWFHCPGLFKKSFHEFQVKLSWVSMGMEPQLRAQERDTAVWQRTPHLYCAIALPQSQPAKDFPAYTGMWRWTELSPSILAMDYIST